MSDEDEKEEKREEDEEDQDLTDEQKWKRRYLKMIADKVTKKFEKGRKVDKGFEGAFASGENTHKYIRYHKFKYAAEPKVKVPESKPPGKPGEYFTGPSKWIPSKPTENQPRKDTTETLQIPEKPIIEHGRREAEGAGTDGKDKDDSRKADALHHDDLAIEKTQNDNPTELVTTLDIETSARSVHDVASRIASQLESQGYEHVSTETNPSDDTFEPSFLEDDLEKMEAMTREDSISPLELSETHERLRQNEIENILENQRQEMLQDFEVQPSLVSGVSEPAIHAEIALEPLTLDPMGNSLRPRVEVEDAEME